MKIKNPKQFTWKQEPKELELLTENIFGNRFYVTPEGKKYPSVTTITGLMTEEAIAKWIEKVGEEKATEIKKQAAWRGEKLHNCCEKYLRNDLQEVDSPFTWELFRSAKEYLDEHVDNVRAVEVPLYSDILQMAGRVDAVAEFDGKLSIIDFKTSSKLKPVEWLKHYFCQAWTYAAMWQERFGTPINQVVIIMVTDSGEDEAFVQSSVEKRPCLQTVVQYRKEFERRMEEKENALKEFQTCLND